MHYILKKQGILLSMDENIGLSFINRPTETPQLGVRTTHRTTSGEPLMLQTGDIDDSLLRGDRTSSDRMQSLLVQEIMYKQT